MKTLQEQVIERSLIEAFEDKSDSILSDEVAKMHETLRRSEAVRSSPAYLDLVRRSKDASRIGDWSRQIALDQQRCGMVRNAGRSPASQPTPARPGSRADREQRLTRHEDSLARQRWIDTFARR